MSAAWGCKPIRGINNMALKYQVDSLEGLDDSVKSLYTEKGGKYVLGVEGLPDTGELDGLKKKVDELLTEKKEATKKAKDAEEAAARAAEEAARKAGDVSALEKSWQDKLAKREAELQAQIDQLNGSVTNLTVGQTATRLAAELAVPGSADVLLPHISSRLKTELRDGKPVTVVLDKDGKPSAMTVDELKNEFASNQAFAPLIVGSKASGGGANGGGQGGGAAKGNMGGSPEERKAALAAKFPDLNK